MVEEEFSSMFTFIHNTKILHRYILIYTLLRKYIFSENFSSPISHLGEAVNISYLPSPTREMAKISPILPSPVSNRPLGDEVIFNVSHISHLGDGPNMLHLPSPK